MNIFITGIAGFLGSHLADALILEGHKVSGCDNLFSGYLDNVPKEVISFHKIDCNDLRKLKNAIQGAEIVYHTAATPHEGLSVFAPHENARNGYSASAAVFSAAIAANVRRIVFLSSMARYGTQSQVPFTEDLLPRPQDPYGIGKYASECLLWSLAQTHGVEAVVAVPHSIYGPRQKYDDPYRNVIAIMINLMLQGRQPFIYGDGEQKRCFSYISDVIGPLCQLATSPQVSGHVVNIGPDEEFITINHLARTIAEVIRFDLKPIKVSSRPQEVRLANCSANKSRLMLGYKGSGVPLGEGVAKIVEWIRKQGPKPFNYYLDPEIISTRVPKPWLERMF